MYVRNKTHRSVLSKEMNQGQGGGPVNLLTETSAYTL